MDPVFGVVFAGLWFAAPAYVDGDAECPGDGSSEAPYCSLQAVLDNDPFEPGTEYLLRDTEVPYTLESDRVTFNDRDGTSDEPLVIGPDVGHSPILRHGISFSNCSHWVVRGLSFDGSGVSVNAAIEFFAFGSDEVDMTAEGNSIRNWGGDYGGDSRAIHTWNGEMDASLEGVAIVGNYISNVRGIGISSNRPSDLRIENNTIEDLSCEENAVGENGGIGGITVARGRDALVAGNLIRDFDWSDCANADARLIGILLQSQDATEVRENWISNTASSDEFLGLGVAVAQATDDPWVHHNVVANNGLCGLCDDVQYSNGGSGTRFEHNTVIGSRIGIDAQHPIAFEARSNVVVAPELAVVRIYRAPTDGSMDRLSWTLDNNLYDASNAAFGLEGNADNDFEAWKDGCNCDDAADVADPGLSLEPEDFTPTATSRAVDLGDPSSPSPFNGRAPDAGAFEAPTVVSAEVREASPNQLIVVMGGGSVAPLQFDPGCAGFEVSADAEALELQSCEALGDGTLALRLDRDAYVGESLTLSYGGPWVRDSARIGGVLDAVLPSLSMDVVNGSVVEPPENGTTGGMTTGGDEPDGPTTTDAETTAGGASTAANDPTDDAGGANGGFPADEGCGCRSKGNDGPLAAFSWLMLFGLASASRARRGASRV